MDQIYLEVYVNGDYRLQFGANGQMSQVSLSNSTSRRFAVIKTSLPQYSLLESIELEPNEVFKPTGQRNLCIYDAHGNDVASAHSDFNGRYALYQVAASLFPQDLMWEKSAVKNCKFAELPPAIQKLFYVYAANSEKHNELIEELVKAEISAFKEINRFGGPQLDSPAIIIMQPKHDLARRMAQVVQLAH